MKALPGCRLLLVIAFSLSLFGCGGSGSPKPMQGPLIPFNAGLYEISGTSSSNPASTFAMAGSLLQNGASISGVMHFTSSACFSFSTDIPASGTLSDTAANVTLSLPNGQKLTFTGLTHPGSHPQFLTGNYSVIGGGCVTPDQGLVTASADGFTGTYTGTFVSSTSNTANVTMVLNQIGPDAHGLFSATGTVTINGGTCFSSATFDPATLVLGKGSTLVLDNGAPGSNGKTVITGDLVPSSPVGFGFISGTYTSTQGACSETGTVSLRI